MKAERPRHIGARIQRFEDIRLLSGSARYIDDIRLPDMLHLNFVRAETAHANVLEVDTSGLADLDFPTWVFTGKDTAGLSMKAHQDYPEMQYSEQPLLARQGAFRRRTGRRGSGRRCLQGRGRRGAGFRRL
ncbi:hypothetical protein [Pseudaminobacter salicylatoxidans]|uniref:hypothetical protein n=1 Tax=Pseudaminobacter salicylatoxidans TaxID=93369 RepID=UPI0002DDE5CB|nr:hypothetical protein [Pseudaminobacter salicylatoxidans]